MNIVVTGGAGFIGSHLCEALLKLGHRVINIDNFHDFYSYKTKIKNVLESTGNSQLFIDFEDVVFKNQNETGKNEAIETLVHTTESKNYKLYFADIRDFNELEKIFVKENPNLIVNLAGLAGVRPSLKAPLLYEDVNVRGTMNILELCSKFKIKKFIQASSSSVYGNNKQAPFKESDIVDFPISPYAATKKSCEIMGHVYHHLYGIDMFQLRFFTVYGERQRPDLAIHKFTKLMSEENKITMYGEGNSFRDYTYIGDIIQGILKSIDYLVNHENVYEILNLGESHTISLKEMIAVIEKELGVTAHIETMPMQAGDVEKTYADISKAKNLIGYAPQTKFEEGIKKFVAWYKRDTEKLLKNN